MIKSMLSGVLALIISAGVPASHVQVDIAHVLNKYTDNETKYTAFVTEDGNVWINEGNYSKNGKYIIVFDDKGTSSVYDDTIMKIYKVGKKAKNNEA